MEDSSVPILMYHSVSASANPLFTRWAVAPDLFDEHLAFLKERQYTPITVTDLVRARTLGHTLPERSIALTFDDAYGDFYDHAFPALRRYGFVATLYIPTAYVGGACDWLVPEGETARPMVTWEQLAEMSASGIECGGHSHNHVQMDAVPAATAGMEITRCKAILEERLGHEVLSFAYPHGWTTGAIKRMVRAAGFTSACAVKNLLSAPSDDPFELARLVVTGDMDGEALERLLARKPGAIEVTLRDIARPILRLTPRIRARLTRDESSKELAPARQKLDEPLIAKHKPTAIHEVDISRPAVEDFEPAAMLDVEISRPLPDTPTMRAETGRIYRRALALVRLHTHPLGVIEMPMWEHGIRPYQLALNIWEALGPQINTHLMEDGLDPIHELDANGLALDGTPSCLVAREAFLANAPFVSVVIPTHNRPQQVVALVHSILASDYPLDRYEIIVVDNAPSTGDTSDLIAQTFGRFAQVRYAREDRPGSSNARNRGLALARGEIVVFADDDELVDSHWLAEMARGFDAGKDVACVTGLVVSMEAETLAQGWFEQFGGYCKEGVSRRMFNLANHRAKNPLYPYNVGSFGAGGSMAFRRSILLGMGGFDLALGPATPTMGGEDVDAMLRVILNGHTLLYQPTAIVRHPPHRRYAQLRKQIKGYGVGLAACLFKTLTTRPERLPEFIGKLPLGLFYAFSSRSPRHAMKRSNYPLELTWLEITGLLYGPLAYLLSRHAARSAPAVGVGAVTEPQAISVGKAS